MSLDFNKIAKDNNFELERYEKITQGVMTVKYLLEVKEQNSQIKRKIILRTYPESRKDKLKFEPEVFKKAKDAGVKVPNYISSNYSNQQEPNYILYDYLEGQTLSSVYDDLNDTEKNNIIGEIVNNLVKLSSISCEKFGPLETDLNGSFDSWKEFIQDTYNQGKKHIKRYNKNNDVKNILEGFLENICFKSIIDSKTKDLTWLDFHPENIIIKNNEFVGFIDFEEMISGNLDMSIGYLFARVGNSDFFYRIVNELNSKRDTPINQNTINQYATLRLFRIAPHLKEDLPTGVKRDSFFSVFKGLFEIYQSFELNCKSKISDYFLFLFGFKKLGFEKQKKFTAFILTLFSLSIMALFVFVFTQKMNSNMRYAQKWANNEKIEINYKKAPSWFLYKNDSLIATTYITDEMKKELIELAPDSIKSDNSYFKEVGVLVNETHEAEKTQLIWLLLASGLISVIGVNIRSLWDFVGNASYKYDLDLDRWWPWYFLRPTIGFLSGVTFYFLYNGGILDVNIKHSDDSRLYFLLGLSGLIGFGLTDFITRLRTVSKAVFGTEKSS